MRIRRRQWSVLFFLLCFLLPLNSVIAESESPKPKNPPAEQKEIPAWSGLYLGRIISVDPKFRYLFVKPLEGTAKRRSFYLDKRTLYREKRKKIPKSNVRTGRKVGIRYIREGDIAYAEGVFLFDGDINPREFEMPKKKVEKKEASAEGEKGEAKKPEAAKASGGHH